MKDDMNSGIDTKKTTAKAVSLIELSDKDKSGSQLFNGNFSLVSGLKVNLEVLAGTAELTVQELFSLQKGSVVKLIEPHNAPFLVKLDGKIIAKGALVVVGDNFGISISEILTAPTLVK